MGHGDDRHDDDSRSGRRTGRRSKPYTPWKWQLQSGALLLMTGAATLYHLLQVRPLPLPLLLAGFAQLGLSALLLRNARVRRYGKQVELAALRTLKFPARWHAESGRLLATGGDIDLYVESPAGRRFAVEIKSLGSLEIRETFFGLGRTTLTDHAGRPVRRDPFPQTLRNAHAMQARAVLWLPRAQGRTRTLHNGVTVVYGSSQALFKAIGVRTGWSLW